MSINWNIFVDRDWMNQGYYIQVGLRTTSRLAGLRFAIQKGSLKYIRLPFCVNAPLEITAINLEMIERPPLSKFSVPIWFFQEVEIKVSWLTSTPIPAKVIFSYDNLLSRFVLLKVGSIWKSVILSEKYFSLALMLVCWQIRRLARERIFELNQPVL